MRKNEEKFSAINAVTVTVCALLGVLWSILVICFLFGGNMSVNKFHVIAACVSVIVAAAGIYGIFNTVLLNIKNNIIKYLILLSAFTVAFCLIVIGAPYSPTHDSLDLELILKEMHEGSFSGSYFTSYMNFFVTNKLAALIYYPFTVHAPDTATGVRIANAVFIWISAVCISLSSWQIKNIDAAAVSFLIMILLCPSVLLCGPYIYAPAIMLSSLALLCYMHKEPVIKVFGYLFAGLLFTMRPTSLGPLLVYAACRSFYERDSKKNKFLYAALKTAVVFTVCLVTQWYIGRIMFLSGTHSLDNLNSSMTLWTLDVGTRDEGSQTGICMHSPVALTEEESQDPVLSGFHKLWQLYIDPQNHYDEIETEKSAIRSIIITRIKTNILHDFNSFSLYLSRKFSNYYRDCYKPYFYAVNINSPRASELLYKNYDYRYFLYENVLIVLFYATSAAGAISTCIKVFTRRKNSDEAVKVFILYLGVICTSIISIMFTEVGKRLIFDTFAPMCMVISINILRFCKIFKSDVKQNRIKPVYIVLSAAAAASGFYGLYSVYNKCNIPIFENCDIIIDEKRNVTVRFEKPVESDGYIFSNHYDEKINMKGLTEVRAEYLSDVYTARPAYFGFILPNGEHIYVAYFE